LTSNRPTIETILGSELTEIFLGNNSGGHNNLGLELWKGRVANWAVEVEKNRESTGETKNNLSLFPSKVSQIEAQRLAALDRLSLVEMLDGRRENPNNITWDMIKSWVNDDVLFQEFKIHDKKNHPMWQRVVTEMKPIELKKPIEEENEDKIVAEVSEDTIQKEYIFCIDSSCLNDIHGLFDDGSSPIFMEDANMMCSTEEVGKAFYSFMATDEELKEWMEMRDTLRRVAGYKPVGVVVSTLNMFPKMKIFPKMKQ